MFFRCVNGKYQLRRKGFWLSMKLKNSNNGERLYEAL